jgi:glyoxylase-like metal-dependent hydrolase (beta-lactamase superfamily II)
MSLVIDEISEIGITRVSRWIFNCYVIQEHDGVIIVDAGLPRVVDDLALVLGRCSGPLKAIVATHGHSDHVAGAPELAQRHHVPIYVPAVTLGYLDGERPRTPTPARAARIWPTFLDQPMDRIGALGLLTGTRLAGYGTPAGMRWTGSPPAGGLTDGQTLPDATAWTVVATPGHTDDSISLWNSSTRTLLSGDAVLSARSRAWHTPEIVDPVSAACTRERLQELPVAHLLPGHGRPVHSDTTIWSQQRR